MSQQPDEMVDGSQSTDTIHVDHRDAQGNQVKGPDPEVWGNEEDRPRPVEEQGGPVVQGLEIGEIINGGTDEEVKGPGHVWEQDDEGNYVNR